MPLFSRTVPIDTPFKKNDVVKATIDLPGIPAGTLGKVKVINGFAWQRYWVFFENGVEVGQLDTGELVRPEHWDEYVKNKALAQAKAASAAAAGISGAETAAGGAEAATAVLADADDPLAKMRAMVPSHLLERSAAARARRGA